MVILDSSVWIDAVVDPSLLKRARRNKLTIAIADEAVLELVAGVVSAATHGNVEQFERRRRACALAAGYSTNPLSPIGIHYARLVGFRTRTTWDVRSALRDVARSRTIESFTQLLAEQRRRGSSFIEWPAYRDSQRRRWVDSIRGAFSTVAQHLVRGLRPTISDAEYARLQRPDAAADAKLLRIEVEELKCAVRELGCQNRSTDQALIERLRPHLAVFLQIFRAAYLDRDTGSHNASRRRVKFEPNDFNDIAQLRYLQGRSILVTSERIWPELAKRTDFPASVVLPSDLPL